MLNQEASASSRYRPLSYEQRTLSLGNYARKYIGRPEPWSAQPGQSRRDPEAPAEGFLIPEPHSPPIALSLIKAECEPKRAQTIRIGRQTGEVRL